MAEITSTKEELLIKYDGNLNEIDADTFFNSIIPFTNAIQEVGKSISPETSFKISIRAPERGSFILNMVFDKAITLGLFGGVGIVSISTIISTISGILNIRKFLKGESPSKVTEAENNNVKIEDGNGQTILVDNRTYNISINNSTVNDSLDKVFATLNKDRSINDFKVLSDQRSTLLEMNRDDFPNAAKSFPISKEREKKEIVNETVIVFKVVFQEKYKWEFYWKEIKISAYIEDETFYDRINRGEEFAKGDRLEVQMEITRIFDDTIKEYLPKSYVIKHVGNHSKPDANSQIEFE